MLRPRARRVRLAHLAWQIERVDCGLAGGKQDQYAAAFGGFNFIEFGAADRVVVHPLRIKPEVVNELEASLVLYYTGRSRESARIIESQIRSTAQVDSPALQAMHRIKASAMTMKEALLKGRVHEVLRGLGTGWSEKGRTGSPGRACAARSQRGHRTHPGCHILIGHLLCGQVEQRLFGHLRPASR
jgi:D-glycero-alpha-D-manno-heptose-7-phosphate kinase